jgi:hypothetical protein
MNPVLRSEYDRLHLGDAAAIAPQPGAAPKAPAYQQPLPPTPPASNAPADASVKPPPRFAKEHATRDEFVKKATLGRIRQAIVAEHGGVTELTTKGFDFHCSVASKKLFGRGDPQRIAVRFVPVVDRTAIEETWAAAQKAGGRICVLLLGNGMTTARELADAITEMRKRSRGDGGVSIIPIDLRDWSAHTPADAPPSCKNILQRLRDASNV